MNSIAWLLSKLRFPLAVNLGGTGKDTTEGLLTDLKTAGAYAKTNVLGAVSQTAGVPTGAIIESGSNANGRYIKYADGTLICTKRVATDISSTAIGAIFGSGAFGSGAYPSAFIATPIVNYSGFIETGNVNGMWAGCYSPPTQTDWGNYRLLSAGSYGAGHIDLTAIGRWY